MLNRFRSLKVKAKILINSLMLIVFMCIVGFVGYNSSSNMDTAVDQMVAVADDVFGLQRVKANMNGARAGLVSMLLEKDKTKQNAQLEIVKDSTQKVDEAIAALEKKNQGPKFADLKKTWEEFRNTRDEKIIPLIFSGEMEKAKELGAGEQAARFKKVYNLSDDLIDEHVKERAALKANTAQVYRRGTITMGVLTGLAVILGILLSIAIANMITRPLVAAVEVTKKIADGDMRVSLEATSKDEVGQMVEALQHMAGNLKRIVTQTMDGANQVTIAADQISDANQNFSQRITEQAAAVEETSSTMEEMSASVRHTAENSSEANKLAQATKASTVSGINVMGDTIKAMDEINKSSGKIANISNVIEEIAFQTNLLALNAAVEAARAGEHGKGFAVVASEIRNLAQRSSQSAKEITTLISESVEKTGKGVQLAQDLNKKLEDIGTSIRKVTDLMDEVAAASQEQASGVNQVNTAISQVDQTTQQNASLVEEMSASSEELAAQAKELLNLMSFFKVGEDIYLEKSDRRAAKRFAPAQTGGVKQAVPKKAVRAAAGSGQARIGTAVKETADNGGFEEF